MAGALNQEMSKCAEAGLGKKKEGMIQCFFSTPKGSCPTPESGILHTFFFMHDIDQPHSSDPGILAWIFCASLRVDLFLEILWMWIPFQAVPLKMIEIPDGWFSNTFCHCKDDDLVP